MSSSAFDGLYDLIRELGRGTTGTVYEAEHLGHRIAITLPELGSPSERPIRADQCYWAVRVLSHLPPDGGVCRIPPVYSFHQAAILRH